MALIAKTRRSPIKELVQPVSSPFAGQAFGEPTAGRDCSRLQVKLSADRVYTIVFSKIDARSGAIGMLPTSIPKAVVTPEFPVFIADPGKLDSGFVQRVLRTGGFLKDLWSKATRTSGRKRISPEAFLDLRVPLPDLAEQQAIVAAYDAALVEAAGKEKAAEAAEAKAMADFEAALGFAPPVSLPDRLVFVASFKDLDRWSHDGVLRAVLKLADPVPTFPMSPLGSVGKVSYGLKNFQAIGRASTHAPICASPTCSEIVST